MTPVLPSALRLTASLWLAAITVAVADPALAARSTDLRPQASVPVADLNLRIPAGRATAQRRLRIVALSVCNSGETKADQACLDRVMIDGSQAIDARAAGQVAAR
jgi:UrcA family protein